MENTENNIRSIKTIHFGELEVDNQYVFTFPNGLLGFEDLQEFVLISDEDTEPFKWLISLDEPNIGFPIVSPWFMDMNYKPGKVFDPETHALFVVVTINNTGSLMTANLKAPVLLNVNSQTGEQVILTSDKYSTEYLIKIKEAEETESAVAN